QEMYIVKRKEAEAEDLPADEQMAQIRAAESRAGGAIAVPVQRAGVGAQLGALDIEPAVVGEDGARAPHARRGDAIEQVDASPNAFDEVFGESDSHEIARPVAGDRRIGHLEHRVHVGLGLANREAPDTESCPVRELRDSLDRLATQVWMNSALHDRKQRLLEWCTRRTGVERGETAREPASAALHRVARDGFAG